VLLVHDDCLYHSSGRFSFKLFVIVSSEEERNEQTHPAKKNTKKFWDEKINKVKITTKEREKVG
jgi:hypothetical protein